MLEHVMKNYSSIDRQWEVDTRKLQAVVEASEREMKMNINSAEIKVLTESGTDEDFLYYITEAQKEHGKNIKIALEKLREAIVRFFSELKTKVMNIIRDKENQAKIDKLEKKIKLFPLAGKKKITMENHEKEVKLIDTFIKKLDVIKAKFSAGGDIKKSDVSELKEDFFKEHGKVIAIGAAITVTVAAAITIIKKMSDNISSNISYNESRALDEAAWAINLAHENFQSPEAAQSIADFAATLYKYRQQGEVRTLKNLINSVKMSISSFGKTVASVTDLVSESTYDDSDLVYNFVYENYPEEIDLEKIQTIEDEDPWGNVIDNDKVEDLENQIPDEESVDDLYTRITMRTEETDSSMDKPMDPKQEEQIKKDIMKDSGNNNSSMPIKTEETDPDMEKINDAADEDDTINLESTSIASELIDDMINLFG